MEPKEQDVIMRASVEAAGARFRPQQFILELEGIGPAIGDFQEGSISLNDRVFVLQQITHTITRWTEWDTHDISFANAPWLQDGLYRIDWSIHNQVRFWKGAVAPLALAAYGSQNEWLKLPAPVVLPGLETLHCKVTNAVNRAAEQTFSVQVIFHGIERIDRG